MRNVVAGNWKSNKLLNDARAWMDGMSGWLATNGGVDVMVAMPAP
ncbi:MAG TPA: triose-phosphate isomerase, partial [Flavobacteriales bacterium]|nr:triose-phosphate isomerase [Flavobacteriales bacterium]